MAAAPVRLGPDQPLSAAVRASMVVRDCGQHAVYTAAPFAAQLVAQTVLQLEMAPSSLALDVAAEALYGMRLESPDGAVAMVHVRRGDKLRPGTSFVPGLEGGARLSCETFGRSIFGASIDICVKTNLRCRRGGTSSIKGLSVYVVGQRQASCPGIKVPKRLVQRAGERCPNSPIG